MGEKESKGCHKESALVCAADSSQILGFDQFAACFQNKEAGIMQLPGFEFAFEDKVLFRHEIGSLKKGLPVRINLMFQIGAKSQAPN